MSTDGEELSDEKRAWLTSVYSRAVGKNLGIQVQQALSYLLAQSSVSTDPIVRAAFATYTERLNLMKIFEMQKE